MQIESRTNPANKVIHVAMEAAHRREKCASVDCNDPLCAVVGFPLGATEEDVSLLRGIAGNAMGVKAAGGIRTREKALAMIASGANRLGCSASAAIVHQGSHQ